MLKYSFLVALNLAVAAGAFAGNVEQAKQQQQTGLSTSRKLDWEQFKVACANPAEFQNQRPPQNIRIACSESCHGWVPATPGAMGLNRSRLVRTAVYSDKYHVDSEDHLLQVAGDTFSCPTFKEVENTVTVERAITCDDILSYKGDLRDYCASALDEDKSSNPRIVTTMDTGKILDTCPSSVAQNKQQQQEVGGKFQQRR